jgi:DNA transformation protein
MSSKAANAAAAMRLEDIPNIGPSVADDLRGIDVFEPAQLVGRDPYELYRQVCDHSGELHDPCLCDTFIAAVRFMDGGPVRPWWFYTPERKRRLPARAAPQD